jgi:Xaa-Pro aminopeptidase
MSHAPTDILDRRLQTVRTGMAAQALDALVVTSLANVLYLTNFDGSSAIAVVTAERVLFITDSRYLTTMSGLLGSPQGCPGLELIKVDDSYDETLAATLATSSYRRVGFEAAHVSFSRHAWLTTRVRLTASAKATAVRRSFTRRRRKTGITANGVTPDSTVQLVQTAGIVESARVRKDHYEMEILREAADRLSAVARGLFPVIRSGMTERELAMTIDWRIREAGFEKPAFETIVASGPRAALPHARPSGRTLIEGDLVVLDFGGVYDSYCVDLTRTVSIGPASRRARDVYAAVLDAQTKAIAAVGPGASRYGIDAAARESLTRAGMGEAFGHGTGHGLGIEVHEDPRIVRRRADADTSDEAIAPGMVFTIEPGAYFPGWGGVRIEDDVVVTEDGAELLTHVTTDLLEL